MFNNKKGILILDDPPFLFKAMGTYLLKSGYEVFYADSFEKCQILINQDKINLVIYSMMAGKESLGLFNRICKFDPKMPTILLDPKEEYSELKKVSPEDIHLTFRHLGPKQEFIQIVERLVYVKHLQNQKKWTLKTLDEIEDLQENIMGIKKEKAYESICMYLASIFKASNVYCWYYEHANENGGSEEERKERVRRHVVLNNKKPELVKVYADKYKFSGLMSEKLFYEDGCYFLPIVTAEKNENLCYFAISCEDEIEDSVFEYYSFAVEKICKLVRTLDKYYEAEALSFIDELTGLFNQRFMHHVLDREIEKSKKENKSFGVLFVDVDHFKKVNDSKGHLIGSLLLGEIGKILKSCVRSVDYCFRYGGDEFIAVLSNTDTEKSTAVAERIRKQIEETSFVIDGKKIKLTLSIGIACFPLHAKSKNKIIQVADEAMYCGKNLTRNIVYVAS